MNNNLLMVSVGLMIIALVSVPVIAAPNNPFGEIQTVITDIKTEVTDIQTNVGTIMMNIGTLLTNLAAVQNDVATMKTNIDPIKGKLDAVQTDITRIDARTIGIYNKFGVGATPIGSGVQILTRNDRVIFKSGTSPGSKRLFEVYLSDDGAADFRVQVCQHGGTDWTEGLDLVYLNDIVGDQEGDSQFVVADYDFYAHNCWKTEFTAHAMYLGIQLGGTLEKDIPIDYSYTVTTDSKTSITENIIPPP